jgi:peptidyl-prolyl cis-trans isomerase C
MKFLKDPLIIFLVFGMAIFGAQRLWDAGSVDADYQIDITPGLQNRILDQWQAQMGRAPTPAEASGLLEQWIKEEIYYREAKTLGLDDNDTIIRRRLAQKLTFLNEDLANAQPPATAELEAFFLQNSADYAEPERFSFEHRYFSSDRRDDAQLDAEAARSSATITGDPFILQRSYARRAAREIADLFGRDFAISLADLDADSPDHWQGPIRSAYGWHLIRLSERTAPRNPPLAEVSDAVLRDFQQQRRQQANEAFYQQLRSRYDILLIEPGVEAKPPV